MHIQFFFVRVNITVTQFGELLQNKQIIVFVRNSSFFLQTKYIY